MTDPTHADQAGESTVRSVSAPSSLLHRTDLILTLALFAFCGFTWYATTQFEEPSALFQDNIQPAFFPRIMVWTILLLSILLPLEHRAIARRGDDIDAERSSRIQPMAYITFGVLVTLLLIAPWLGTLLTIMTASFVLPLLWGERRLKLVVPFAILFPIAVTVLFSKVLQVYFEPGLLGETVGSWVQ
ncbi:MAG: tripartite tricarboxylate transporter TctB family protein [Proteobacteria bacterium]|nr:tripartite tricarboxylate transporter TctB family protein [Pseudomonadota bacterium]